ncbi:hypothetical protein UFOVP1346_55 [uncultured Caudovirales phage]|uniref:YubB ferredoxin-like domain-containing protein n=1 Tax=uncultured Caudovirales phage TaxID=2100421 RepID=A0A6J5QRZ8_9CAUD|nr:hypothetical protein UFOVP921_35 [uncultured Caudovirales phage]CAB4187280.1 hypothetical protein UFOVP1156_11 [uncultured Caudovirales phage]CAB4200666.1 hypothetical protein UFOVP1346_55 [uncultured Caudovirales phage]
MPNWCQNTMVVLGTREQIEEFEKANKGKETVLTFEAAVPKPESEKDNWYNWNCEHWGTKWDACDAQVDHSDLGWECEEGEESLTYSFDTAWSDPASWFEVLGAKWPDLKLILNYVETGMDFSGQHISERKSRYTTTGSLPLSDLFACGFEARF